MNQTQKSYPHLMGWIFSLISISYLIGFLAKSNMHQWYETIQRSPLTPPNDTFSIVWTILYVLIAMSGWIIYKKPWFFYVRGIKILYGIQLFLNLIWTPLFFNFHWVGGALVCLLLLVVVVFLIMVLCYRHIKIVSILFAPYFLWLLFATYLNGYIWMHQ
jgi:benzodiazapine receptor